MIAPSASVFPVTGSLSGAGGLEDIQTIASRAQAGEAMSEEDLQKVGQKFEALLLHNLLTAMRKTVPENPLFGESQGEKMYWDMFDESMAETAALSSSTGISQVIVEELKRQQEQTLPPAGQNPFRPLATRTETPRPVESKPEFRPIPRESSGFEPIQEHETVFRPIPGRTSYSQ